MFKKGMKKYMSEANINLSTSKNIGSKIRNFPKTIKKDFRRNKYLYLLALPVVVYYILLHYVPMYGIQIAFKDFRPIKGIWGSEWIGLENFQRFLTDRVFQRAFKNTILLSIYDLFWGFPAPIILALLLNELRGILFKRVVQTISYLPHFVSIVVIAGMIVDFSTTNGIFNDIIAFFGFERTNLLIRPELFRTIYIGSGVWQGIGFGSIIYLSALSGIDQSLYEAANIDGAGRWKQMLNITLPSIAPQIVILLILRVGHIMGVGFDKIFLLYNPATYETADVISTYVYRKGLIDGSYSYSAAIGLFNNIINLVLMLSTNKISKKFSETSLW
jgi:putative aldouronate transport system permease protein